MKRQDGLIICDYHKRGGDPIWHGEVLDDGITFINGYIAVENNQVTQMISEDPNNHINQSGVLHNRHKDQNGNSLVTKKIIETAYAKDNDTHFCNITCLGKYHDTNSTPPDEGGDNDNS